MQNSVNKRIKVLHFCTETHIGGTESMLIRFLKSANHDKFEYHVAAIIGGGILPDILKDLKIPFNLFPIKRKTNFLEFLKSILSATKYIKSQNFDIIHLYGYYVGIFFRIIARILKVPVIIIGQRSTDDWRNKLHSLIDKITSKFVTIYISNSKSAAKKLIDREGIRTDKIIIIPNGVDFSDTVTGNKQNILDKYKIEDIDIILGTIANFRPMKGHQYLLQIANDVIKKYPATKFVWIGDGPILSKIKSQIALLNLEEKIILPGYVKNVYPLLSRFDIFILPSDFEGMPGSILEAMSIGCPVIATNVGDIPEIINHLQNGVLISPKNTNELFEQIIHLIENKEIRKEIGATAIKTIEDKFSLNKMTSEIEKTYERFHLQFLSQTSTIHHNNFDK